MSDESEGPDEHLDEWMRRLEGFTGLGATLFQCYSAMQSQGFSKSEAMDITLKFMELQFNIYHDSAEENT